MCQRINVALRC